MDLSYTSITSINPGFMLDQTELSTTLVNIASLETYISALPNPSKYKCISRNKDYTRKIPKLSETEQLELKKTLNKELVWYDNLYKYHKNIDSQCMKLIDTQLETLHKDTKMKSVYNTILQRYNRAKEDKSFMFLINSDRSLSVPSVMGTKLLHFIITFHSHHCNYTNMFKDFCGDTTKEIKRLDMILGSRTVAGSPTCVPETCDTTNIISELKEKIANIDLDIDEEW